MPGNEDVKAGIKAGVVLSICHKNRQNSMEVLKEKGHPSFIGLQFGVPPSGGYGP